MMEEQLLSAIGVLVELDGEYRLVQRRSHREAQVRTGEWISTVHRHGLRLVGDRLPAGSGVIAALGSLSGSDFRVAAVRHHRVEDVFDRSPSLRSSKRSSVQRPDPDARSAAREAEMLESGEIDSRRYLRAEDGRWRVIVSAADPESVRPRLEPVHGSALTLVASPWSRADLDRAREELVERTIAWQVAALLDGTDENGLSVIRASVRSVTPEISAWLRGFARGMIELHPFLHPNADPDVFADESVLYSHRFPG
ncbi:hypothetical protein [Rathayibacter sp. VKM Ac-2857]|uniref:hypothetical protein n=1 Tax=Rathayibacter sp. VKM Ac-2857 TaxID=2739020 RepID=UPI001564A254|nr:hypothetical protein [Rathayibacter sp. VKM Ac-2857]NQX16831.1 hypothetical protein [Rathayibacter sp. VKM Ac-2857]